MYPLKMFLLSVTLIFYSLSANAQIDTTMQKYSYPILLMKFIDGLSTNTFANGTGFFLRENESIFLITALHVFSGNGLIEEDRRMAEYPNFAMVPIANHGAITIDVSSFIKSSALPIHLYPDIVAYKIESSDMRTLKEGIKLDEFILSIDYLPRHVDTDEEFEGISIFGYPTYRREEKGIHSIPSDVLRFDKDSFTFKENVKIDGTVDQFNSYVFFKNHKVNIDSIYGYSGSPVFQMAKNPTDNPKFLGVLVGGDKDGTYLVIIKPEYVFESLNNFNKK